MKRTRLILVLAAVSLIVNGGCGKKSDLAVRYEMEKLLNEADRLQEKIAIKGPALSDSDFKTLVDAYLNVSNLTELPSDSIAVIKASPELIQTWELAMLAYTRVGILYYDRNEFDKAYGYFEKIIKSPSSKPVQRGAAITYMALCRENKSEYRAAAALYDSLAAGYPDYIVPENPNVDVLNAPIKAAEMWQMVGDNQAYHARLNEARAYYNRLLKLYPDTPFEDAVLGKIVGTYLREDNFNDAISLLESTRDSRAGLLTPRVLMLLSDIYMKSKKDFRKAEHVYREFIRDYPSDQAAGQMTLGLGLALFEQGKYAEARKAMKDIEKCPGVMNSTVSEAYYLTALCYEKVGQWETALGQFDLIQAKFAGMDKAYDAGLHVANYYKQKGQTKLAQSKFQETAEYIKRFTNPETSNPLLAARSFGYLARCYTEMGELDKVIETLGILYERYPLSRDGRLAPLRLADLYENEKRDYKNAAKWLAEFIEINPGAENIDDIKNYIKMLEDK